ALSFTTTYNHTAKYCFPGLEGRGGVSAGSSNYPVTGYVIMKWVPPSAAKTGTGGGALPKFYAMFRDADRPLSYAEALNNLTGSHTVQLDEKSYTLSRNTDEIKNAFNLIRYRAGLPGLSASQLANQTEVQKQIERERMVEFLWENRRFYDVRRW